MSTLLIALPCALVLIIVVYGVISSLLKIWLEHRVKLAFMEKLDKNPGVLPPFQDVQAILEKNGLSAVPRTRHDYTLTGLLLAAIGVVCAIYGTNIGVGEIAVGTYIGGILCIGLGIALAVVGLLLRSMLKPTPSTRETK
ncbi:MAG: hypothetical protein HZB26_00080 [Candidatus Hydrogenedentes bacterium]|nr:hypothetical protein [Candidatus Hydrogenedentota bacterium]